jgi:hypothetical protein
MPFGCARIPTSSCCTTTFDRLAHTASLFRKLGNRRAFRLWRHETQDDRKLGRGWVVLSKCLLQQLQ